MKKINDASQLEDPVVFNQTMEEVEKAIQTLMLLPEDLYKTYQAPLQERLASQGYQPTLASEKQDNTDNFDQVLSVHPSTNNSSSEPLFFEIKGMPAPDSIKLIQFENQHFTPSEQKFIDLKTSIAEQENNPHFIQLVHNYNKLQHQLQKLETIESKVQAVDQQIAKVDQLYYRDLNYIFLEAVEKITGLVIPEEKNIMKGLMKTLIVDDLGEKTKEGLISLGYAKKHITILSTYELKLKYGDFLIQYKSSHPGKQATLKEFLNKSPEFEPYDIIYINQWNFQDKKLPVQLRIKTTTIYSKKEQRLFDKDPEKLAQQIQDLTNKQEEIQNQLKQITTDLQKTEEQNDISEEKYQTYIKQRKRVLKNYKKNAEQLKKLQKPDSKQAQLIYYTRGLIETLREQQSMIDRLRESTSPWRHFSDFLDFFTLSNDPINLQELKEMIRLARFRHQAEISAQKMKVQIATLTEELRDYAQKNQYWKEESGYQSYLDDHILKKLELAVLASSVAFVHHLPHHYQGNYFQVENWNDEAKRISRIENIKIAIATNNEHLSTEVLQGFFRISKKDQTSRILIISQLPTANDYINKTFHLLIIDQDSFSLQSIFTLLKTRNRLENSHIPVLLLNLKRQSMDLKEYFRLHCLIGFPTNQKNEFTIQVPPYQIYSLTDHETLIPILSQVMGIPIDS